MNTRTTETKITWHLERTEEEDACFHALLLSARGLAKWEPHCKALANKLLSLIPREETDETISDDLDFNFSLDDFERRSAIHDAAMGVYPDGAAADNASNAAPAGDMESAWDAEPAMGISHGDSRDDDASSNATWVKLDGLINAFRQCGLRLALAEVEPESTRPVGRHGDPTSF